MNPICSVPECARQAYAFGMCGMHATRYKRHGDPLVRLRLWGESVEVRFWAKVQKTDNCWLWLGAKNQEGYGHISENGKNAKRLQAHRVSYELVHGAIPDGLHLDHLCRNPGCVNPDHLEAVTRGENIRRGYAVLPRNIVFPHCRNGHAYTPENTWVGKNGKKSCKTCNRLRHRVGFTGFEPFEPNDSTRAPLEPVTSGR